MKILGSINIGNIVIQVDRLPEEFSYKAPIGSYIFDSLENVREKTGRDDEAWTPSTFRVMMLNILSWATTMLDAEKKERLLMLDLVYDSILKFKGGEITPDGKKAVSYLKNNCHFIGFTPSTTYIMAEPRGKGSMNVFWEHPFSMPSGLWKDKNLPMLIISNGNIDFDDSRLAKMKNLKKIIIDEEFEGEIDLDPESGLGIMG